MIWSSAGRNGFYGVDTPFVPAVQAFLSLMMLQLGLTSLDEGDSQGLWLVISGSLLMIVVLTYLHASRRGKFRAWSRVLGQLDLSGQELVLDLGCGRGAVTTLAAARVPDGKVVGVDVWRQPSFGRSTRRGTEEQIARRNAVAEDVAEQVEYRQGDLDDVPIPDATFDVVVSGMALSALRGADRRAGAVDEAVRLAKPGARIAIADLRNIGEVAARLSELGCQDVNITSLGPETWFGGPWLPLRLVSARTPA
ncbi:MAG: class I SAM-dependent methyltransferase [Sporichthyaceae bacterium]